jgi:hypothetical protein
MQWTQQPLPRLASRRPPQPWTPLWQPRDVHFHPRLAAAAASPRRCRCLASPLPLPRLASPLPRPAPPMPRPAPSLPRRCPSPTWGTSHTHVSFYWDVRVIGVIGVKWRVKLLWLNWNYEIWFKCGVEIVRFNFGFEVWFWNWNYWVSF